MTTDGTTDPAERLLLEEALALVPTPQRTACLDVTSPDVLGALAESTSPGESRAWVDSARELAQLRAGDLSTRFTERYDAELLSGAELVLTRLPRSLDALAERAAAVAAHADPPVTFLAAARIKHLNRSMTTVLERHFSDVRASLGRYKSRVLIATEPLARPVDTPKTSTNAELQLQVAAFGGVFAGSRIDAGTRALIDALRVPADATTAVDLGCGTGVLATWVARTQPGLRVIAVDDSAVACWSATATAALNGLADRIEVRHADLSGGVESSSVDLVVCNPPFHRGTGKDSSDAFAMITEAGRLLRSGGELWLVYNAHLPYLPALHHAIGETRIVSRTQSYLVTRSVRA